MGCGESKHSVATANTVVSHREKPAQIQNDDKAVESVLADEAAAAVDQAVQQPETKSAAAAAGEVIEPADGKVEPLSSNCEEEEEKKIKKGGVEEAAQEEGRLIDSESPNQFFSSREDSESIGRVASERSVYFSPSRASKEIEKSPVGQEEGLVTEETKAVTEKGEEGGEKKEEGVVVKEGTEVEKKEEDAVKEDAEVEKNVSESKHLTANDEEKAPEASSPKALN